MRSDARLVNVQMLSADTLGLLEVLVTPQGLHSYQVTINLEKGALNEYAPALAEAIVLSGWLHRFDNAEGYIFKAGISADGNLDDVMQKVGEVVSAASMDPPVYFYSLTEEGRTPAELAIQVHQDALSQTHPAGNVDLITLHTVPGSGFALTAEQWAAYRDALLGGQTVEAINLRVAGVEVYQLTDESIELTLPANTTKGVLLLACARLCP